MSTKKILVSFNPDKPMAKSNDFLVPVLIDSKPIFLGLSTGNHFDYGLLILLGKNITSNDVFAKMIDLGLKIDNVDLTLNNIDYYLESLKNFKISNVIELEAVLYNDYGFTLVKSNLKPTTKGSSLP